MRFRGLALVAAIWAGVCVEPRTAFADTRIHFEEGRFAFEIGDAWQAIPEESLPDPFVLGFLHRSGGEHPAKIAIRFMTLEVQPTTPRAWMRDQADNADLEPPIYDAERRILTSLKRTAGAPSVAMRVVHFGRDRVAIFFFGSPTSQFDSIRPEFDAVTASFAFDPGYEEDPLFGNSAGTAAAIVAGLTLLGIYLQKRTEPTE